MSKITTQAAARCAAHTMQEQLAAVREKMERESAKAAAIIQKRHESSDEWSDVRTAFAADACLQTEL